MQDSLFELPEEPAPTSPRPRSRGDAQPRAVAVDAPLRELAAALPPRLRLGTSSWNFPGWQGLVWAEDYAEARLSKQGLPAYAAHPLLRTVSLDRAFYRPLSVAQYAAYAAQVPADFRFVVKAPSLVSDALIRDETGRGMTANLNFLDPDRAVRDFVEPALAGLGGKLGALVFQLSPLPARWLDRMPQLLDLLARLLAALTALQPTAPDAVIAIEVRDEAFLDSAHAGGFAQMLREHRATYCLGLHARLPPVEAQLPLLRALWPGPLVCRWNLHRRHGAHGYAEAKQHYAPFNRIVDADLETRATLARVIRGTTGAGQNAYVTINNKAEGSAPLSVAALAEAVTSG